MKKNCSIIILLLLSFAPGHVSAWQPAPGSKPNIILILADDLGYETIACNGGTSYQTPNIDRLASKGIRFTNAYATPLCTPSRLTIMTGKYNFRNYVNFGAINPNEYTFGNFMKSAGYKTFVTGKWQLGDTPNLPAMLGFDAYTLWHMNHQENASEKGSRYRDPVIVDSKSKLETKNKYGPDIFNNKALAFIEENKKGPFFLYYPMVLTHAPFQPTPEQPSFLENMSEKSDTANFRFMVRYMDKLVGRIVDKVEQLGIAGNTIIIFTGDNGTHRQITSMMGNIAIQGAKATTIVHGTHVPLVAWWKGKTPAGAVYDDLVDFTDFLPTFARAVNKPLPEKNQPFDGIGFYDRLAGKEGKKRDWLYCYYSDTRTGEVGNAIRYAQDKTWKLYSTGKFYNIVKDPVEKEALNIAGLPADVKQRHDYLRSVIEKMMSQERKT